VLLMIYVDILWQRHTFCIVLLIIAADFYDAFENFRIRPNTNFAYHF